MNSGMIGSKWPEKWYEEDVCQVARHLLGAVLVHVTENTVYAGRIVETEAYGGTYHGWPDDAAHSYHGRTARTEPMFQSGGCSYVYQIYGMYYCMNVVTGRAGSGEAVLIRAVEPLSGLDDMFRNRNMDNRTRGPYHLTNGPGKLCQAMEITKSQNKLNLCGDELYIAEPVMRQPLQIACSARIHVDYAEKGKTFPWRYYIENSKFVSRP